VGDWRDWLIEAAGLLIWVVFWTVFAAAMIVLIVILRLAWIIW
jgi:hypothetical protein